ncbi:hypothetical protein [Clostridium tertium]|uniref:hypothetical protein n=1 Tax=Clostridium tertium TaxID=1559 RepID=UPI0023B2EB3A|nr:hypothetical protein [Clostridium tertium]
MKDKRAVERAPLYGTINLLDLSGRHIDTVKLKDGTEIGISFKSNKIYEEKDLVKFRLNGQLYILYIIWCSSIGLEGSLNEYGGQIFQLKEE